MKRCLMLMIALLLTAPLAALDGEPGMHDPSTVIVHDGKFYVYATGNGLPIAISDDGWTWRRAGTLMQALPGGRPGPDVLARGGNNTWAPDVIRSGDKYFVYYSAPGTQPKAAIGLLVGRTLDPAVPDYKWEDGGPVSGRTASRTAMPSIPVCFAIRPMGRSGSPTAPTSGTSGWRS